MIQDIQDRANHSAATDIDVFKNVKGGKQVLSESRLNQMMASDGIFGGKAVAELHPYTTVMVADLVGFTAWARYVIFRILFFSMWQRSSRTLSIYQSYPIVSGNQAKFSLFLSSSFTLGIALQSAVESLRSRPLVILTLVSCSGSCRYYCSPYAPVNPFSNTVCVVLNSCKRTSSTKKRPCRSHGKIWYVIPGYFEPDGVI